MWVTRQATWGPPLTAFLEGLSWMSRLSMIGCLYGRVVQLKGIDEFYVSSRQSYKDFFFKR